MIDRGQKGRYRRKGSGKEKLLAAIVILILAAALVWVGYRWKEAHENGVEAESFKDAPENETEENGGVKLAERRSEPDAGTDVENSGTERIAEQETEPPAVPPTKPPYLENLSGLTAGTILDRDQIDFDQLDSYFMSWKIEAGDNLYERINGKSYRANDYVPLHTLRYLKMPHVNYDGQVQVGEMIVNEDVEADVFIIFKELFRQEYQIQSMYLVDNYWTGDPDTTDSASIDKNNTSAFCYREITGGGRLSNHAYGRAIDLNPQQNPYVSFTSGLPKWVHSNADDYIARDTGLPHVITHEDLAYKIFIERGFNWGGDWTIPKDYQHFDKNN